VLRALGNEPQIHYIFGEEITIDFGEEITLEIHLKKL